ncbi:branched-chain amino acid ABC transporter permease [Gallicola sp. Sow4_E12]|uniref:branched-chain amino acid ABC transporter permease n=1 Tax=Gallicola sp. Sow4_E12 TaxID=3438785 RepID=UPI003F8EE0CA
MPTNKKQIYILTVVVLAVVYAIVFSLMSAGLLSRYWSSLINLICINIILAVSLNVTVGTLGQITLGHAGFMSIGAYAAGLFSKAHIVDGLPGFLISLVIAGIVAGIVGVIIGIPGLRLRGDYLAIITLAFGEIIRVLIEFFDFTGGAQGLSGIPRFQNFTVFFILMAASVAFMYSMMTSRHGRAILAIREDEIASDSVGINTTYYKVFAFVISAVFAGIAGGMYAHQMGVLNAKQFDFNYSINILVMVVLGGMGSFTGATISATVLTILPEMLRGFNDYRMIIYSLILIIMMIFRPSGLLGRKEFHITKFVNKFRNRKKKEGGELRE